jgi:lysophospholipase L1-like esterase
MTALFSIFALIGLLFSTGAFAKDDNGKSSLVALGDSITAGYGLDNNNNHVSKKAFPFYIGKAAVDRVRDLGDPGISSDTLKTKIETDSKYIEAIKHADWITLDIGSIDLRDAAKLIINPNTGIVDEQKAATVLPVATGNMVNNIDTIITDIKKLTNAPIVVYNIYNPILPPANAVGPDAINYNFVKIALENDINLAIYGVVVLKQQESLADAYTNLSLAPNAELFINPFPDSHPTTLGQEVLGKIGLGAFPKQ